MAAALKDAPKSATELQITPPVEAESGPLKPISSEEIRLPMDPSGYMVTGGRGLFSLVRLYVKNRLTQQIRELCVPVNMGEQNWRTVMAKDATGQPFEAITKAVREDYTEQDRDSILAHQVWPNGATDEKGRPIGGRPYGFASFDPLSRGEAMGVHQAGRPV